MKSCTKCKVHKPLSEFFARKDAKDGRRADCKSCNKEKSLEWARANRAASNAIKKRSMSANPEKRAATVAAYLAKEATKARRAQYYQETISYTRSARVANTILYRSRLKAVPLTEFDKFVAREAVLLCKQRQRVIGGVWHVDHVVPVAKGGTSVATNLQVVPAIWNFRKNKHHSGRFLGAQNGGY